MLIWRIIRTHQDQIERQASPTGGSDAPDRPATHLRTRFLLLLSCLVLTTELMVNQLPKVPRSSLAHKYIPTCRCFLGSFSKARAVRCSTRATPNPLHPPERCIIVACLFLPPAPPCQAKNPNTATPLSPNTWRVIRHTRPRPDTHLPPESIALADLDTKKICRPARRVML